MGARTGIQLGLRQRDMVESRLRRRAIELGLSDLGSYRNHLRANMEQETEALVSLLTTHHTYFFREFSQFEFLESRLPALANQAKARGSKTLDIWSAACSRGQEVYSLAMFLHAHLPLIAPGLDFRILGSDVDPESVKIASNGVYRRDEIKTVPLALLGAHWSKGSGEIAEFVKAKKTIREKCEFQTQNLQELAKMGPRKFDVIFCRNVFIYFTPEQIKAISTELERRLHSGGFLAIGLSESLHGMGLPLKNVGPSIYSQVIAEVPKPIEPTKPLPAKGASPKKAELSLVSAPPVAAAVPNPLRVLCVDDSSSILALLKKMLTKENGFEVIGTAANGIEAAKAIASLKPDLVTLDIHMPECSGVDFLKKHYVKASGPAVVMVSSVSREDAGLALSALSLGAADYVEKPALNNMAQVAEELRAKLKTAYRNRNAKGGVPKLDRDFAKTVKFLQPEKMARIFVFTLSDIDKAIALVRETKASGVPLYLALEGAATIYPEIREKISRESGVPFGAVEAGHPPKLGSAYLDSFAAIAGVVLAQKPSKCSVLIVGEVSSTVGKRLVDLAGAQFLLEDLGGGKGSSALSELVSDAMPFTSFAYMSDEFLGEKVGKAK